jgi:hypothetical protein
MAESAPSKASGFDDFLDHALVHHAEAKRVVDAVRGRPAARLGEHQLVGQRAAVARLDDVDRQAGLLLEVGQDAVGQRERVVRDQRDGAGRVGGTGLGRADGRAACQRKNGGDCGERVDPRHG